MRMPEEDARGLTALSLDCSATVSLQHARRMAWRWVRLCELFLFLRRYRWHTVHFQLQHVAIEE